jgi:succinyl-CoA synthetase alpha subunit
MTILADEGTRVVVQAITGRIGAVQTRLMLDYGTKIVAGVTPGKGGTSLYQVPVYDTVSEAKEAEGADASIIFVPAPFAADAAFEALDANFKVIVLSSQVSIYQAFS